MYKGQNKKRKKNLKRGFSQVYPSQTGIKKINKKNEGVDKRGWSAMMLPSHRTPVLEARGSPERAWEESVFTFYFRLLCHVSSDLWLSDCLKPLLSDSPVFLAFFTFNSFKTVYAARKFHSEFRFGPKIVALQHLTSLQHTHTNHLHTSELLPFITAV